MRSKENKLIMKSWRWSWLWTEQLKQDKNINGKRPMQEFQHSSLNMRPTRKKIELWNIYNCLFILLFVYLNQIWLFDCLINLEIIIFEIRLLGKWILWNQFIRNFDKESTRTHISALCTFKLFFFLYYILLNFLYYLQAKFQSKIGTS